MATRQWVRLTLVLAIGAAGCAGREKPGLGKPAPPAVVNVANNNYADVTVYLVHAGQRRRLGTVTGLSRQAFTLPRSAHTRELYLLADPVGGARSYLSPAVHVRAGEAVDLRLHPTLSLSSVSVWGP